MCTECAGEMVGRYTTGCSEVVEAMEEAVRWADAS
jgi:hypothetical protein